MGICMQGMDLLYLYCTPLYTPVLTPWGITRNHQINPGSMCLVSWLGPDVVVRQAILGIVVV